MERNWGESRREGEKEKGENMASSADEKRTIA